MLSKLPPPKNDKDLWEFQKFNCGYFPTCRCHNDRSMMVHDGPWWSMSIPAWHTACYFFQEELIQANDPFLIFHFCGLEVAWKHTANLASTACLYYTCPACPTKVQAGQAANLCHLQEHPWSACLRQQPRDEFWTRPSKHFQTTEFHLFLRSKAWKIRTTELNYMSILCNVAKISLTWCVYGQCISSYMYIYIYIYVYV